MPEQKQKFRLRSALFPAGYYGASSIYQGYISLYYTHLGFSGAQLGFISAATAAASLAVQPLWGLLGDRAKNRKHLLGLLNLLAALALPTALAARGFPWQILSAVLFYIFFCALLPLGDTILLETQGARFGAYRLAGGLSFALTGAAFGLVRSRTGPGGAVWMAAALLAITAGAALLLPDSSGKQSGRRVSPLILLRTGNFAAMLAFTLPLQMTMACFYTYYAPRFKGLPGANDALLGLGYLLSAFSEAPYLLLSGRICRRFGAALPMCIAAGLMALRWGMLALAPNAMVALASQLLHGGGFIVISVSMAFWISENVPGEMRASGQALLNMTAFGAARIMGNLMGAYLAENLDLRGMFGACAILCAASAAVFLPFALKRRD